MITGTLKTFIDTLQKVPSLRNPLKRSHKTKIRFLQMLAEGTYQVPSRCDPFVHSRKCYSLYLMLDLTHIICFFCIAWLEVLEVNFENADGITPLLRHASVLLHHDYFALKSPQMPVVRAIKIQAIWLQAFFNEGPIGRNGKKLKLDRQPSTLIWFVYLCKCSGRTDWRSWIF